MERSRTRRIVVVTGFLVFYINEIHEVTCLLDNGIGLAGLIDGVCFNDRGEHEVSMQRLVLLCDL